MKEEVKKFIRGYLNEHTDHENIDYGDFGRVLRKKFPLTSTFDICVARNYLNDLLKGNK